MQSLMDHFNEYKSDKIDYDTTCEVLSPEEIIARQQREIVQLKSELQKNTEKQEEIESLKRELSKYKGNCSLFCCIFTTLEC